MNPLATIILAAGKGTRMKSEHPKVIFKMAGKAMINRVIDTANEIKSDLIVVVIGYKRDEVKALIPDRDEIKFAIQDEQLGTGHAVKVTEDHFKDFSGDVVILCGDVPLLRSSTLKDLIDYHRRNNMSCTILTAIMANPLKYGRIVRTNTGDFLSITEYKDASDEIRKIDEINTGIYCFKAKDLFSALHRIKAVNNQGEYYLTDTPGLLIKEGKRVGTVLLDDMMEASGVNSLEELSRLEQELLKRNQK